MRHHSLSFRSGAYRGTLHELCQVLTVIVMMQEKNGVIEQLEKERQKKGEQVQQAHADLARQAALIKHMQAHPRGKKESKPLGVPAEQVCTPNLHATSPLL